MGRTQIETTIHANFIFKYIIEHKMKIFNELLSEVIKGQISYSRLRKMIAMIDKKPEIHLWVGRDATSTFKPDLFPHDIAKMRRKLKTFLNTLRSNKEKHDLESYKIPHFSAAKIETIKFVGIHQEIMEGGFTIHRPVFQWFYKENKEGATFTYGEEIKLIYSLNH